MQWVEYPLRSIVGLSIWSGRSRFSSATISKRPKVINASLLLLVADSEPVSNNHQLNNKIPSKPIKTREAWLTAKNVMGNVDLTVIGFRFKTWIYETGAYSSYWNASRRLRSWRITASRDSSCSVLRQTDIDTVHRVDRAYGVYTPRRLKKKLTPLMCTHAQLDARRNNIDKISLGRSYRDFESSLKCMFSIHA